MSAFVGRRRLAASALSLAIAPIVAKAQVALPRVAYVSVARPVSDMHAGSVVSTHAAFFRELIRLGLVEGRTVIINRHSGSGRLDPYRELAREIIEGRPDVVVVSGGTPLVAALKALTATIPLVVNVNDPVASGLVTSLSRPDGNITGFTADAGPEINGKALELMTECLPFARRIAYLDSRSLWDLPSAQVVRASIGKLGLTLLPVLMEPPVTVESYQKTFGQIVAERPDAVYVGSANENYVNAPLIAQLAVAASTPACFLDAVFARAGGLMSYGPNLVPQYRGMAGYVDRILKGAKPADLPIQLPTTFDFVINLKTAKALGLTIPERLLVFATEVIE